MNPSGEAIASARLTREVCPSTIAKMPDAELRRLADRYLEALLAHAPARLELAPGFRFTENGT